MDGREGKKTIAIIAAIYRFVKTGMPEIL